MPEWLKGADCKSAVLCYVGSNPTRPKKFLQLFTLKIGKKTSKVRKRLKKSAHNKLMNLKNKFKKFKEKIVDVKS